MSITLPLDVCSDKKQFHQNICTYDYAYEFSNIPNRAILHYKVHHN